MPHAFARRPVYVLLGLALGGQPLAAQIPAPWSGLPPVLQIRLAVQAAPEEMRDGATVQGWNARGEFVTLRAGTNALVCMAPNPERENFEVSCHHRDLEPFFERGRELSAAGLVGQERMQARYDAYTRGEMPIPYGATNYILHGSGFAPATGEVTDPYLRWVVYTPEATPETTGISTSPSSQGPWLMFAGTPGAHIMITPPRGGG